MRKVSFWGITAALPIAACLIGLWIVSYRSIPPFPVTLVGDPLLVYDPEIGFVPRPDSRTERTDHGRDGSVVVRYHVYTDHRGARVSAPGEQTPAPAAVLFVGDSLTWGHGVEDEQTFAKQVGRELGVTVANISMGSYGTTQALQMLGRNLDLQPQLIVHPIIADTLRRNVSPCAPSYFPFCNDYSYVGFPDGRPAILPPRSNGVRRIQLHAQYQRHGLDPLTWLAHGVDVAYGLVLAQMQTRPDRQRIDAAFAYLLEQMSERARAAGAKLLIVYLPTGDEAPVPEAARVAAAKLGFALLDLSEPFARQRRAEPEVALFIPNDGHPTVAGHALIARETGSFIRRSGLLQR